jgi:hypothetical protein
MLRVQLEVRERMFTSQMSKDGQAKYSKTSFLD